MNKRTKNIIVSIVGIVLISFILYVVIFGFYVPPPQSKGLMFSKITKIDDKSWRINITGFEPKLPINETKCIVEYYNLSKASQVKYGIFITINFTNNVLRISFSDSQNDNIISDKDYFLFEFDKIPQSDETFEPHFIYIPTGAEIHQGGPGV